MLPTNVLYYGQDQPPRERSPLRAGPLTMVWEEGGLRYIRLGELVDFVFYGGQGG